VLNGIRLLPQTLLLLLLLLLRLLLPPHVPDTQTYIHGYTHRLVPPHWPAPPLMVLLAYLKGSSDTLGGAFFRSSFAFCLAPS